MDYCLHELLVVDSLGFATLFCMCCVQGTPLSSFLSNLKRSFTSAFDKSSQETGSSDKNGSDHEAKREFNVIPPSVFSLYCNVVCNVCAFPF